MFHQRDSEQHERPGRSQEVGLPAELTVVLATEGLRAPEFMEELRELIRESRDAVLISLTRPIRWNGGPVVGIAVVPPVAAAGPVAGPAVEGPAHPPAWLWLGPLRTTADRHALLEWLRGDGPRRGHPPARIRSLMGSEPAVPRPAAPGRSVPKMVSHTWN